MYLKTIEIQGFKSFAHKTVLSFNQGMTAIVGPNGSGKSNISDAVRWVLGEQKVKQLRSSSMQDVIFSGTEFRKPLGFASVTLVFDNADHALALDYQEVSVSRRIFRSGESEYLLNGQNVRLRDVQELFFDTGIGKEGYSIIGQGQIEAIVSGRPEDRRGLFDEACGIVKFKKRKAASVKKLEDQEAALVRIADIVGELEKRVGPLEKQSRSAREYLKIKSELRKYDLNLYLTESETVARELDETEKNLKITEDSLVLSRAEDEKLRSMHEELSEKLAEAEKTISEQKEDQQKGELLIGNLESQIAVSETEIRSEQQNISIYGDSLGKLALSGTERAQDAEKYAETLELLSEDLTYVKERFSEGEGMPEEAQKEAEGIGIELSSLAGRLKQLAVSLPENSAEKQNRSDAVQMPDRTAVSAEESSEEEEDEFVFEEPEWLKAIRHKKDDLSEIREREEKLHTWMDAAASEYNALTAQRKELETKKNSRLSEYQMVQSRHAALKNIAERYEGYGQTVQSVMQTKERFRGIRGVVADILTTQERYETAIETALGGRIQNVVTDTEQTARQVIEYLKKHRFGRATFLPMDAVRAKIGEEYKKAAAETGCLGLASDLTDCDSAYEEVKLSLLGNTLVFDGIENALAAAGRYRHSLRIVTLEGELLSPGGAISGGSFKNSTNLLGRARELAQLSEQEETLRKLLAEFSEKVKDCEKKLSEKSEEIENLEKELSELREKKHSIRYAITSDLKVRLSNLRQSLDFLTENIGRLESETETSRQDEADLRKKIAESSARIQEKEAEILLRKEDIAHVRGVLSEASAKAEQALQERAALQQEQKEYFDRKDTIANDLLLLEKERIRLQSMIEKSEQKQDEGAEYLWEEYGITASEAEKEKDASLGTITVLRQKTSELRRAIKALGPVNVQAIEEYREVSSRYELMKKQYSDISLSKEQIEGIIRELDEGMKRQFAEQFENIRKEFASVFATLFGGGIADLELTTEDAENEDELSAGILITAQPPGKKLQNMMQLSGGEKALTAIALLFAIQNLKPSPFCLLDEIEAALDDSNVLRFAQYIKNISERTQFILITHRRGTMETADRLYGVTMQEKGVTSLVSVDLVSDSVK